jgi:hypothetical protein
VDSEELRTAPLILEEALNRALAGDPHGGGMLLAPLIEDSARECYALCAMLATTATYGLEPRAPGGGWALEIDNLSTGAAGAPEDLAPELLFAARFVTAWANEDHATTTALFGALIEDAGSEAGMCRVVDGVLALYGMAVASVRALLEVERRGSDSTRED